LILRKRLSDINITNQRFIFKFLNFCCLWRCNSYPVVVSLGWLQP
jgi:hypothetical protein